MRNDECAGTVNRFLVTTLGIRLKPRGMAPSNQFLLDVCRLRDESVAQDYKRELAESLGEPDDSVDPEKFCTHFKTKVLNVCKVHQDHPKGF